MPHVNRVLPIERKLEVQSAQKTDVYQSYSTENINVGIGKTIDCES